ncbi:MAG TPA: ATP-binding protein [Syntrophales bacterium]|nr:ATP-binding protein [Syntrophales bacterium]
MSDHPLRRIGRSLAGKLILSIGILIILGGGISWYVLISTSEKNLMNHAVEDAASYSDLVRKGIRFSMLTFNRDAIQQTIEQVAARKEIQGLRIFDSRGKIFSSSKKGEIGSNVDSKAEACTGCHEAGGKPSQILAYEKRWLIHESTGGRVLTFIEPLYNEPSCTASCHVHPEHQRVLGILQTDISLSALDKAILSQTINITIYAFVFMAVSAVSLYFVLRRFVLKPLSAVDAAMEKVGEGRLGQTVAITSEDEMGRLASTFNSMTKELADAREKMENWTKSLEEGIEKKTEELKRSQDKLIQAEKLASLGRLTADVAHEIRNPLTALGGFARRLHKIAESDKEKEYSEIVLAEADRLEKILKDVLTFSRDARSHLEKHNIEEIVHDTLKIYEDLCREQSIRIETNTGEGLLPVLTDRDQVRQALGNLITNAVDAMPGGGELTVAAGREEMNNVAYMFVRVVDTGEGIQSEDLPLIFEPFYSTKKTGHGTGLGLSITRKIMEEHGGFIRAESAKGRGSAFTIYFPYQSEEESLQVKCWEYMKCGRDKDSSMKCPAYPNLGRVCWAVAGTFCEGKVQGTFAQKYEDCKKCEFYQKIRREELT